MSFRQNPAPGSTEQIANEFLARQALYGELCESMKALVGKLIAGLPLTIQSLTSRVKDGDKLAEKLSRRGKHYSTLAEVTDLAGIRVITYLPEDVDKVAALIEREFQIDRDNSIDKRITVNPDSFGYSSLHLICSHDGKRSSLPEYAHLANLKCEVQIRTVLQHAWAEIEHDLGYKTAVEIPQTVKRRFSRLAALLEAADDEFMRIKAELAAYSAKVASTPSLPDLPLDTITLQRFIETDAPLASADANF